MNLYAWLLERLPLPVARTLMVLRYLLLVLMVFMQFFTRPGEFRYIDL